MQCEQEYEMSIDLYSEVEPAACKWEVLGTKVTAALHGRPRALSSDKLQESLTALAVRCCQRSVDARHLQVRRRGVCVRV